ncbi:hypothetical protein KM043_016336 [Ampulex compressa]|nr:hypothetical protein KM043_016336 [Ampulex compressa]
MCDSALKMETLQNEFSSDKALQDVIHTENCTMTVESDAIIVDNNTSSPTDNLSQKTNESINDGNVSIPKSPTCLESNKSIEDTDTPMPEEANHTEVLMHIEKEDNSIVQEVKTKDCSKELFYNWASTPKLLCAATKEYESTALCENFTKGCQWSPDGTCLLVPSEDFRIRIYELPRELYSGKFSDLTSMNFTPALTIKEGGLIYDSCWYPHMNSWDPVTCCFLSTSKESPVHLWDAFTGELRATYRAYNQVDEVEASISTQFIESGKEVWCGFKNVLRMFDTERPGRQVKTIQFKTDFPNMSGLVSCIRENPIMPGLVAFGTYSKYIGLYKDAPLCTFKTESGVTQIEFSPCGTKLFSAVRRNSEFLCWDLRNPGVVLYSLESRQSNTNQRIQFSMPVNGDHIVSGGTDGNVIVWNLSQSKDSEIDLLPQYKMHLSDDCINGVSLHKSLPILATSSGQRLCDIETRHRDNSVRLWWAF